MADQPSILSAVELLEWERTLEVADRHNIFCHCRQCGKEWIASTSTACICGSKNVQSIACWQFPDD